MDVYKGDVRAEVWHPHFAIITWPMTPLTAESATAYAEAIRERLRQHKADGTPPEHFSKGYNWSECHLLAIQVYRGDQSTGAPPDYELPLA